MPSDQKCLDWSIEPVLQWCLRDGRFIDTPTRFVEALAEQLLCAGAPVWRVRVGFRTLHPQVTAWAYVWQRGKGCRESSVPHEILESDMYRGSPIQYVYENGEEFRRRLDQLDESKDHNLLFELKDEGGVDYLALPLFFSDRQPNAFIVTTDSPAGFSQCDCAQLRRLTDVVAPILEIESGRRITRALMNTYLGPRTGERVLSGQIRRGDGEEIDAALWFSDLRGFTPLSETLPADKLLAMLNEYFEFVTAAVTARGGEVLRFIGDAMLVVFPIGGRTSRKKACHSALDAALDAVNSIATVNHTRRRHGEPEIRFGVGLHEGQVIYGNVGAPNRLDFTVMGPAVNRTARLESLTKELDSPILMSEEFVDAADCEARELGSHKMKGIEMPRNVFAPL